jgi:ribonuclease J
LSALSLVASGQSRFISIDENDCVVFSSHTIPGNEMGVNRIINGLMRRGATVIHDGMEPIHVSGHASADELATLISLVKPEYFIPVHGEHRHMKAHSDIAIRTGIDKDHVFLCHDGDSVVFEEHEVHVDHDSASGAYLYVDGNVGGITNALLRDRRQLGEDGLVVCVVTVDYLDGEIIGNVEVVTRGWVPRSNAPEYLENAAKNVRQELEKSLKAGERNIEALKAIVRKAVGRATNDSTGRKPTIIPLVIEA